MANNHDVVHAFANQTTDHKAAGHLSFDRETLKSYAAIIGRIIKNKAGQTAVLFSDRHYSVTTSSHQGRMRSACSHLRSFTVPDIYTSSLDDKGRLLPRSIDQTFQAWERDAQSIIDNLKRARKASKYISQLHELGTTINDFAAFVGKRVPAKLRKLVELADREDFREQLAKQQKKELAREAKRKREQQADNLRAIQIWQAFSVPAEGERVTYKRVDRDYLRYDAQAERIETSQHVQVPVRLARELYSWLKVTRANGGCNSETECNYRLLNAYSVRTVNQEYFAVGCHTIYFDEVERIANLLGWE